MLREYVVAGKNRFTYLYFSYRLINLFMVGVARELSLFQLC
jgi:hypothetical protein